MIDANVTANLLTAFLEKYDGLTVYERNEIIRAVSLMNQSAVTVPAPARPYYAQCIEISSAAFYHADYVKVCGHVIKNRNGSITARIDPVD